MSWAFVHPERIHLLWAVLALLGFLAWRELRGSDLLGRFVSPAMQGRLARRPTRGRRVGRLALIGLTAALSVVALMRPQSRRPVQTSSKHSSADIMVLLDVSKSMLADDAAPSRLERAKAEVRDLVRALEGNRFGLVAFAGRASVLCPLTSDYGFFRMVLDTASPASVSRGGTRIGEGIRAATRAFPAGLGAKVILLITDGEDHDSYPIEAAKEAAEKGAHIVSIGFGSEDGSEITIADPKTGAKTKVLDADGKPVISRLDGETLRKIALATEGVYVPAGTAVLDLKSILEDHIEPLLGGRTTTTTRWRREELYPWLVLGAMAALFLSVLAGRSPRRRAA